jgi:7-cyano-7-deazaguanine synthase in queuosine biosynthesis
MSSRWRVRGLTDAKHGSWEPLPFSDHFHLVLAGHLGPAGLSARARDLLTVGFSVFSIERSLSGYSGTNRPCDFEVELKLEETQRWTRAAINSLVELLAFQGDARWSWNFKKATEPVAVNSRATILDKRTIERVVLFSGGLDSMSGIATLRADAPRIQLVSHYSKQKSAQLAIASALGYGSPTQARIVRRGLSSRGRSYLYRSFYFLCLGAAVASSYKIANVTQFENGVLAAAIPPAPPYFMTRHAHPMVHRHAENLFGEIFGTTWKIDNPFVSRTKRECVAQMRKVLGGKLSEKLISKTETCWYVNSYQLRANRKKKNGVPCGVCIPCIIRRTALGTPEGHYDLNKSAVRADTVLAREFHAYSEFVSWIWKNRNKPNRLWLEMPDYVRQISEGSPPILTRDELTSLLVRFAKEFRGTF